MMRRFLFCLATILATVTATAEDAQEDRVRILTYNIHHGEGTDGKLDLERIASVIRAASPDIVCLQEVDQHQARSERIDEARLLAEKLDMDYVFASNYDFGGGGYGNATLTRHKIIGHQNHPLPNPNDAEPRGVLQLSLQVGEHRLQVFNTHFGLRPDERSAQAAAIVALLDPDVPTLLAGDLNEDEEGDGVAQLLARLTSVHTAFDPNAAFTSPARAPKRRIDFILYHDGFTLDHAEVVHASPVEVASDHLPVLAVFRVPPTAGLSSEANKE